MPPFTTEFTQAQVDALTKAIALGVKVTEHNGKRTEFNSTEEMLDLRDRMKLELSAAAAAAAADCGQAVPIPYMTRRTVFIRD